jgi:hypothetical protein
MKGVSVRRKKYGGVLTGSTHLKGTERRCKKFAGLFLVVSCTTPLIFGYLHSSGLSLLLLLLLLFFDGKRQLKD